jgi:hypothetical protein
MVQLVWPLDGMIWSLQILRFIAALMVVYTHAAQIALADTGSPGILPLDLVVMGRSGVDISLCCPASRAQEVREGLYGGRKKPMLN